MVTLLAVMLKTLVFADSALICGFALILFSRSIVSALSTVMFSV